VGEPDKSTTGIGLEICTHISMTCKTCSAAFHKSVLVGKFLGVAVAHTERQLAGAADCTSTTRVVGEGELGGGAAFNYYYYCYYY
jgi:hypothetical protein